MKKLLFIIGLGGIGYGFYYYFKKQLDLALDFDFKFKDVKVTSVDKNGVDLALLISVLNKSSFAIEVIDYDIDMIYEGTTIANAKSSQKFTVQGDSSFDVPTNAYIQFKGSEGILDDFIGDMNIVFGGIPKEVIFNAKDVVLTDDLAETIGIDKTIGKLNKFLEGLGIKI